MNDPYLGITHLFVFTSKKDNWEFNSSTSSISRSSSRTGNSLVTVSGVNETPAVLVAKVAGNSRVSDSVTGLAEQNGNELHSIVPGAAEIKGNGFKNSLFNPAS